MTQLAQDTKTATLGEVVTAIQQRSAALGELLKEAAANENNPDALKAILEKLDGAPAATAVSPSSGVRPHEQFKLEVFDSKFGQGVRFVQPAGMTLRTMTDLINIDSRNTYNRDAIYRGNLLKDGGNVNLIEPYDAGVFLGSTEVGGLELVSPVQMYLDLYATSGRGEEGAEALLREVIQPTW